MGKLTSEEPCYGTSATAIKRTDNSQPKYIRITDFDDFGIEDNHEFVTAENYSEKHLLHEDDILFARTGATVGKTYFYDGSIGKAIFAGYCIRFRFNKEKVLPKYVYWYTKTSAFLNWVNGIQRPAGQPNVNKEEYKSFQISVPDYDTQIRLASIMDTATNKRNTKKKQATEQTNTLRKKLLAKLGIRFNDYIPVLFSATKLHNIKQLGLFCNPHSAYLSHMFSVLQNNDYSNGVLKDYVLINPGISRTLLSDSSPVSFVPMPNVGEKNNIVSYEIKDYRDVKVGFTPFKKGDLLWAKITPCMQNGKSFIASDMPTEYGFGSTEFHVIRAKDERLYIPFLWMLLSDPHVLEAAQGMFSGSAGQQRVTEEFLKNFPIVLPPYGLQKELADEVLDSLVTADKLESEAEKEWQEARKQFEKELLGEI